MSTVTTTSTAPPSSPQHRLSATRDADLVRRIGQATALEMAATGIRWNFAPVVAAPWRWSAGDAPMRAATARTQTLSLPWAPF
ncbi:MAG: glycoside hydrolase family 3 N-terminal domain-containing protein [Caldilineaceae bacterium]